MKKTYFTYIIAMASLLSAGFVSCDKQLSEPPANARVDGTAVTDEKTAQIVLNGVYARFANVTDNNITDWTANNVSGGMLAGTLGYGFGQMQDEKNDNINAGYPSALWGRMYGVISAANGLIKGVEETDAAKFTNDSRNEILAEARFLRAYSHFKLLMYFAEWKNLSSVNGVLIREEFTTLSGIAKKRSTVSESYEHILADLDFAVENAPEDNPNYYATSWAAKILKARVLITRGQSADFDEVISLANDVINNSPYALEPNTQDLFHQKGLASSEVILGVKPQPNQEAFYYILSRSYYPAASSMFVATKMYLDLFENDPRKEWNVGPASPYQMYSPDTYYFAKFILTGTNPTQISETNYVIRLAEAYHLKAEAIIRSKTTFDEAKDAIKEVLTKGGVTDFTALDAANTREELWEINTMEVLKGFTGEDAIEWFTLIRMPLETVSEIKPTVVREQQFYFPVPQSEFDNNHLFGDQNTGYGI